MTNIEIPVTGMSCGGCVSSVQKALSRISGVAEATATLSPGSVSVRFDAAVVDVARLVSGIEDAGYGVPEGWLTGARPSDSMGS